MRHECVIPGCRDLTHARGWCRRHYTRWRNTGDPNKKSRFASQAEKKAFLAASPEERRRLRAEWDAQATWRNTPPPSRVDEYDDEYDEYGDFRLPTPEPSEAAKALVHGIKAMNEAQRDSLVTELVAALGSGRVVSTVQTPDTRPHKENQP